MATENIKTKIQLACDTLADWGVSTRKLLAGEIAIAMTDKGAQVYVGTGDNLAEGQHTLDVAKKLDLTGVSLSGLTVSAGDVTLAEGSPYTTVQDAISTIIAGDTVEGSFAKAIKDAIDALSDVYDAKGAADDALSTAKKYADDNFSKVTIDNVKLDVLPIVQLSVDEYAELVAKEQVDLSTLYIFKDSKQSAFGQRMQDVAPGTVSSDAATYGQLTSAVEGVTGDLTALSDAFGTFKSGAELSIAAISAAVEAIDIHDFDALSTAAVVSANAYTDDKLTAYTKTEDLTDWTVSVTEEATPTTGSAKTYTITQTASNLSAKIEIPHDKVIKSGSLVWGVLAEDGTFTPKTKAEGGSPYVCLVVDDPTETKIYVAVPELVDTYVGHDGTTVKVEIVSDEHGARCIKAEVKENSLTMAHFSDEATFVFCCGGAEPRLNS